MSSEREKVEHRVYPRFERFVIGKEWKSHDEAFYQAKKTNFAQAAYWFWLFSEINDAASRKVCVLISRIGKKHYLNGKKIVGKNYSQNRFRGASWCWTYENQKVETLFQGMAEVEIGNKKIEANLLDSSHTIQAHGSFPNYTLRLLEDGGEVGFFKTTGTRFSQPLTQNKYLKMRSIQAISDGKESFA
ncbi:MAG TPA: hypothetical protein EYP29_00400, partial [Thermoplasmata archaeon]|nr:hypothetical protein [Thermoplasmata archaeon]